MTDRVRIPVSLQGFVIELKPISPRQFKHRSLGTFRRPISTTLPMDPRRVAHHTDLPRSFARGKSGSLFDSGGATYSMWWPIFGHGLGARCYNAAAFGDGDSSEVQEQFYYPLAQ